MYLCKTLDEYHWEGKNRPFALPCQDLEMFGGFEILASTNTPWQGEKVAELSSSDLYPEIGSPPWTLFATCSTHLRWK
jgi:hypothetical protein